jgi:hypothetical protein
MVKLKLYENLLTKIFETGFRRVHFNAPSNPNMHYNISMAIMLDGNCLPS